MRAARVIVVFTLVVLAFTSACAPEPAQTANVIEKASNMGQPFYTELPMSNCTSAEDLVTAQQVDQKYMHRVDILTAPNTTVNPAELQRAVRDYYKVESLVEVASYTVDANVPKGLIFIYQIEWTELWREGEIEIGDIDGNPEATYKFLESLTGGVTGINTATCP